MHTPRHMIRHTISHTLDITPHTRTHPLTHMHIVFWFSLVYFKQIVSTILQLHNGCQFILVVTNKTSKNSTSSWQLFSFNLRRKLGFLFRKKGSLDFQFPIKIGPATFCFDRWRITHWAVRADEKPFRTFSTAIHNKLLNGRKLFPCFPVVCVLLRRHEWLICHSNTPFHKDKHLSHLAFLLKKLRRHRVM